MTRDEVIEIATQVYGECVWHESALQHLEAFVNLVADKRVEGMVMMTPDEFESVWDKAQAEEREACAKLIDELPAPDEYSNTDKSMWEVTCIDCADAIRARGDKA